jgi:hypothetical protein
MLYGPPVKVTRRLNAINDDIKYTNQEIYQIITIVLNSQSEDASRSTSRNVIE